MIGQKLLATAFLITFSVGSANSQSTPVGGIVTDPGTGGIVANILLQGTSTATNSTATGSWTIGVPISGWHTLIFTAMGYRTRYVDIPPNGHHTNYMIFMWEDNDGQMEEEPGSGDWIPAGDVMGYIVDSVSGNPIQGAVAYHQSIVLYTSEPAGVTGLYMFSRPLPGGGSRYICASADGYVTKCRTVFVSAGGTTRVDFQLVEQEP